MHRLLSGLRTVFRDDRAEAYARERSVIRRAIDSPAVDPALRGEFERSGTDAIAIGSIGNAPDVSVRLPRTHVLGTGHSLVVGATATGKTRAIAGIARNILQRNASAPDSCGACVVDHKGDLAALTREMIGAIADHLPSRQANALLDRLVIFDPFSTTALVAMQILRPEPGLAPEVQAFAVTSLIDRLGGADLGVRQDAFLFHLVLLGIMRGMTLPEIAGLLNDPASLTSSASDSPSSEVRSYFSGGGRIAQQSLEGVRARLHRLLRLPSARLMLGANGSLSFHEALASKILVADLGSPPIGCEDLARFWSGLVTLFLMRAVFARSPDEAARPVAVFVDEWQEGLAAGADIADGYERALAMARSRGVSFWLCSQSLAGAAKVSASLPKVVATNTALQLLFRASPEDARAMAGILPVTGRKQRAPSAPWEPRPASPFLSIAEEREGLVNEVASLPERTFYLWNRRWRHPAVLVRALDVTIETPAFVDPERVRRLREGSAAVPIEVLSQTHALFRRAEAVPARAAPPIRRRRPI